MKYSKRALISLLLIYLLNGVFLSQFELNVVESSLTKNHPKDFYDYSGVLNIHTSKSTGSGSYQDIVLAAQSTGLDFIFITDLNDIKPDKTAEKYYDHLLVFIDSEISYLDSRILFYGRDDYSNFTSIGQAQATIADRLTRSEQTDALDLMVLAHPYKKGNQWKGLPPPAFTGIEILNLKSVWQSVWLENKISFLWSVLIYPFNPELALIRMFPFPEKEFELWDTMNKKQKTLGFAGADAEARLKFPKNLKAPSYETLFNIVRTHILLTSELTGDFDDDSRKIKDALNHGQFYMSLDKMANPVGFNATIKNSQGKVFPLGSSLPWQEELKLEVSFKQKPVAPIDIMIFKDGEKVVSSNSALTTYQLLEPGVYRIVVRIIPTFPLPDGKKWVPWIIANPFFVAE